jgi:hypothetical protein
VINIITKTGVGAKPGGRIDGAFGSFNHREGNASIQGSNGPWSASIFGNAIRSDGYRDNNEYRQDNGVGDFRYSTNEGSLYLNLSADDQHIGLPGHRRVEPSLGINKLVTDRKGAFSPFDWGGQARTKRHWRVHPHVGAGLGAHCRRRRTPQGGAGAIFPDDRNPAKHEWAAGRRHDSHHRLVHPTHQDRFQHRTHSDQGDRRFRLLSRRL